MKDAWTPLAEALRWRRRCVALALFSLAVVLVCLWVLWTGCVKEGCNVLLP